ncbi:hypothetical protein [Bdellovibrio sp. HCB274]|uniref:hypothetical protein n=1 Tax=Bdellovibrio sp. HCB274 TaxID=3394361 RepID=UPI0039B50D48
MKCSIALLALLFSCSSFAQQNVQQPPSSQIPVFGKARVKVNIFKNTIERVGDGFKDTREEVCTKFIDIDVYDIRFSEGVQQMPPIPFVSCVATLNNVRYQTPVWLYNIVTRVNGTELKTYWANLTAYPTTNIPPNAPPIDLPGKASASTKQLDLGNMIFNLEPNQGVYCYEMDPNPQPVDQIIVKPTDRKMSLPFTQHKKDNCQIVNPTAFGATVEFETL